MRKTAIASTTKRSLHDLLKYLHTQLIVIMKLLTFSFACTLLSPNPVLSATILTPPITREPCTTILLPNGGTACVPKLTQRHNVAPRLVKLGDTIRTQYRTDAKRLCHHWGGTHLIAVLDEDRAWDCFKLRKTN